MNSFKHYLVVLAISALPFITIFISPLMPHTHDGPVHLARMAAYYKAITGGQILPRWADELNYDYGTPLFNFMYHVPYLVTSIPIALGAGLVFSFKLALLLCFLLSGLFMYLCAEKLFANKTTALIVTIFYQFAPFHLVDLVVRGDLGEGFAFTFLPLVLYAVVSLFKSQKSSSIIPIGVATALLILSHNSVSLVFFGTIVLFILWLAPSQQKRIAALMGLGLGLALSAFYWFPAMAERKYTYGDLFMKDMYKSHFAPLWFFFVPNFTNAFKLQIGGIAVSFGFMHILTLGWSVWLLITKKTPASIRRLVWYALFLLVASLIVMQPISKPLWEHIALLRIFQFPWRLLTVVVFALSLLAGTVWAKPARSKLFISCVITVTVLSSLVYWSPPWGFDKVNENDYWNYPLNTTYFGETDVVWSAGPAGGFPKAPFEIIEGDGAIATPKKQGIRHTFLVYAKTSVRVVDHTQYFPGWRVYVDGDKVPIEFQDQNWRGTITFRAPAGTHSVLVMFGESPIRTLAEIVSVLTLVGIGFFILIPKKH